MECALSFAAALTSTWKTECFRSACCCCVKKTEIIPYPILSIQEDRYENVCRMRLSVLHPIRSCDNI
jgi:hypothetical protein